MDTNVKVLIGLTFVLMVGLAIWAICHSRQTHRMSKSVERIHPEIDGLRQQISAEAGTSVGHITIIRARLGQIVEFFQKKPPPP